MTVGEKIKNRRIELEMTQDELAKKCGYASRSSIQKIEASRNLPLDKIEIMARVLDLSISYLAGWEERLVSAYAQGERDGAILNVVRQLNDANAQIVLNLANSLLMQQQSP